MDGLIKTEYAIYPISDIYVKCVWRLSGEWSEKEAKEQSKMTDSRTVAISGTEKCGADSHLPRRRRISLYFSSINVP
jgi:hypothetical protein